jgi:hypothetical protein
MLANREKRAEHCRERGAAGVQLADVEGSLKGP